MTNLPNPRRPCLHPLLMLILTMSLNACIDLSGSSSKEKQIPYDEEPVVQVKKYKQLPPKHRGEVHTMRGGLGIFSIGMNQLRDSVANQYHVPSSSTMWYKSGEVGREIAEYYQKHTNHRPIILVGHSLGANEQIMVARYLGKMGIPVDLLVTVDSVSVTRVPANVKEVLNIYKPGYVPMFSGLKLKAINPETTHVDNVNVNQLAGVDVNHFTIDKDDVVQNMILNKVEKVLSNANKKEA